MTDRDRWGLRGPVRSCRLQRTWYSRRCDGDLCTNEERRDTTIVEFRPDGSLARRWHRNPDGSEWESTHEYDSMGRLVTARAGNTAGLIDLHHYNYDSAGRLERVLVRGPDDRERIAESYEYDAAGRKRKTLYVDLTVQGSGGTHYSSGVEGTDCAYSAPGAVTVTTLHNTRDQPAELLFHDSAGRVLSRVEFVYDEAGNLLEEMLTKHPAQSAALVALLGADPVRRLYRYDAQGRRIETHHSVFGSLGRYWTTMAYNENGDLSEETFEHEQREYTIDDHGRLVEGPAGASVSRSEARFRYDYDARGNWVEKVIEGRGGDDRDFLASSIEKRTLAYNA